MSALIWDGTPLEEAARSFLNSLPHRMAFLMGAAESSARTMFVIEPDATEFPNEAKEAMLIFLNVQLYGADPEKALRQIEGLVERYRSRRSVN